MPIMNIHVALVPIMNSVLDVHIEIVIQIIELYEFKGLSRRCVLSNHSKIGFNGIVGKIFRFLCKYNQYP